MKIKKFSSKRKLYKMKKQINTVKKQIRDVRQMEVESNTYARVQQTVQYVGKLNTQTIDQLGEIVRLTGLAQNLGSGNRRTNRVKFLRIKGNFSVEISPNMTLADGLQQCRAMIIRMKKVLGSPATHAYPTINDVFTTTGTLDVADVDSFRSVNSSSKPNYQIVWDKRFALGTLSSSQQKCTKTVTKQKGDVQPQYLGTAWNFQLPFNIKCADAISSFDDTTDTLSAMNENHYFLLFWIQGNATANKYPFISGKYKSYFICQP